MAVRILALPKSKSSPDRLPDTAYAAFTPPTRAAAPAPPPIVESSLPESAALARQLAGGELGFTKLVVVQRQQFDPTHVYTYHVEGQKPGGGLYLVDLASGKPRLTQLVDASEGLILDANVSYDGQHRACSAGSEPCRTSSNCTRSTWTERR